jgi:DNA invertase Pin-like site-specific DNA recombinase
MQAAVPRSSGELASSIEGGRRLKGLSVRVVIYARYSSDNQREASIEDQIRLCRERIEHEGWIHLHAYVDRAISGSSALRPAYQRLLEDARNRQFDIVVAEALDRLSRDQEDVAGLLKRLRFAGIRLFTLAEGEIGELHVGLKGTMNALFLTDLKFKVKRGLSGRIKKGKSAGGLAYATPGSPKSIGTRSHSSTLHSLSRRTAKRQLENCVGSSKKYRYVRQEKVEPSRSSSSAKLRI